MGWWSGDNPGDVIGDGPADAIADIFERLRASGAERPKMGELLAAIAAALSRNPAELIEDPRQLAASRIVAEFADGMTVEALPGASAPKPLTDLLHAAFDEIAVEYRDTELKRRPRLSELLETVAFVLAPDLDKIVADGGKQLTRIVAKPRPDRR
jgi:hypothetical protein